MTECVFFAWLSIITLVASTPVPQEFPSQQYASQQTPFKTSTSISAPYQAAASQINPYTQQSLVQNQAPIQGHSDGTLINELLMSKIFRNPCLQKILDPETKLYNRNGREIQRQPNTGATPSVINNYFIVPPEFFNLSSNRTKEKVLTVPRRRKVSNRKANLTKSKTKVNVLEDKENIQTSNVISISDKKNKGQNKNREKKKKQKLAKIIENNAETNLKHDTKESKPEEKNTRKRKKQELKNAEKGIETFLTSDDSKVSVYEPKVSKLPVQNNTGKRRKKTRTELHVTKNETEDNILTPEIINNPENFSPKINKTNSVRNLNKSKDFSETGDESQLKNIESPVDNKETKSLQENSRPTKHVKEDRITRNPNVDKVKKEHKGTRKQAQNITPISDDYLKNFYPYMYLGNNFYSNGNRPFNFEQFYQPYIGRTDVKNKNGKKRKNHNEQDKKDSQPNVVELKLKPKKQQNATTVKPMNEEITDKTKLMSMNLTSTVKPLNEKYKDELNIDFMNIITSTESPESNTDMPVRKLKDEKVLEVLKEDTEIGPDPESSNEELLEVLTKEAEFNPDPEPPKEKPVEIKSNLEISPTVIEDLHEYITPELGSEDIVPIIQTNGLINDYYPVFNDESNYANDESYYLRDLEDDRHFYATGRGFEEPLNTDHRKYDRYEDFPSHNLDIKDHINFRRTYKFREREKTKFENDDNSYIRKTYPENVFEKEIAELNNNVVDHFQTPPLLEHPDFMTTKIEKVFTKSDVDGQQNPIYIDPVQKATDHDPDIKPIQYSRLLNFDGDIKNDKSSTNKPRSDRIETVFAKTRVVKYGVSKDEAENTSSLPLFDNDDDEFQSDGHTTYVLAKTLGHSDDYFW